MIILLQQYTLQYCSTAIPSTAIPYRVPWYLVRKYRSGWVISPKRRMRIFETVAGQYAEIAEMHKGTPENKTIRLPVAVKN